MSIEDNVFDLLDEMAEPTGPIAGWKAQVHFKQYLNDPDMTAPEIGKAIAAKLRRCKLFMEESQGEYIIYNLEHVADVEELDEWLEQVYDTCDSARIWCGTRKAG